MLQKEIEIRKTLLNLHKEKLILKERFNQVVDKVDIDYVIHAMAFVEAVQKSLHEELEVLKREGITEPERLLRQVINKSKAIAAYQAEVDRGNRRKGQANDV